MADPLVNFFKSTLVGTYSNTATSFTIATGDGALLPDPSTDGEFNLVVYEGTAGIAATAFEIVRVTGKSGDVLTVTREQEGTTALTIGATTHSIILSATKKTFNDKANAVGAELTDVQKILFDTGSTEFKLPVGTTSERPASPQNGYMRYNTDVDKLEVYIGTGWSYIEQINPQFKSLGIANATSIGLDAIILPDLQIEYLVIAGGGGGGGDHAGGGGGGGGYRSSVSGESSGGGASAESPLIPTLGSAYTVTVGAGGSAGTDSASGSSGSNSVFSTITSTGGGVGASVHNVSQTGGSGGGGGGPAEKGAGGSATTDQGYDGGDGNQTIFGGYGVGGGGGGAGQIGQDASSSAGNGGNGVSSSITGSAVTRAGGGGGGGWQAQSVSAGTGGTGGGGDGYDLAHTSGTSAESGTANTGGGGGGSNATGNPYRVGGAGGSGIVIIKYPDAYTITVGAGLTSSTTTSGGYSVTTFTAGTGTISFA